MAKKVSKKASTVEKQKKATDITVKLVFCILLFAAGFVIGCAASARSVYNSKVDEREAINAIEPSE